MLEPTEDSPYVYLDAEECIIIIKGRSFMEDTQPFARPIIQWLRNHIYHFKKAIKFEIELDYINSASHQMLLTILAEINKYHILGYKINVIWTFHHDDEYMSDVIKEFKEVFVLPIKVKQLV